MAKINVHEATREQLDRLVAMAAPKLVDKVVDPLIGDTVLYTRKIPVAMFKPTTNGAQCMELIEEHGITLTQFKDKWYASFPFGHELDDCEFEGDTAKIAACRAYVISKLGEEVEI